MGRSSIDVADVVGGVASVLEKRAITERRETVSRSILETLCRVNYCLAQRGSARFLPSNGGISWYSNHFLAGLIQLGGAP